MSTQSASRCWPIAAPRLAAWSGLAAPASRLRCVVVLPVRNEADRLERALEALSDQVTGDGLPLDSAEYEVLLLANNCDDDSADIARRFAATHPRLRLHVAEATLQSESAHIGFVRGELMNEAWRRLRVAGHASAVIASTDADSRVDRGWLAANLAEIDAGADAVGGRILIADEAAPTAAALRRRRLDAAHALLRCRIAALLDVDAANPWPNHHQHFGASLAVRATAYERVGGVPPVRHLEDEALVRSLERADFRIRRSPLARVSTSGRLDGRADVGLSWQLRQWTDAEDADPLVDPVESFVAAMRARAELRASWRQSRQAASGSAPSSGLARAAKWLGIDKVRLREQLDRTQAFGALWAQLDEARLDRLALQGRKIRRSEAMPALRQWLRRHAGASTVEA